VPPVINPAYPFHTIRSVEELTDIAAGMEREAALRYEQLADAMDRQAEPDLAAIFRELAEMERDHEAGIGRWAAREGRLAPAPASFSWHLPETFDEDPAALTPYGALGIAVRNEERAFVFYSYLSALAPDGATQAHADALAREELKHVSQLRALRRRAFHRERPQPALRRAANAAELDTLVAGLDQGSLVLDEMVAAALEAEGDKRSAALLRHRGAAAPTIPGPGASPAIQAAVAASLLKPGALTADGALRLALRDAEEVVEILMSTAEQATDEDLLNRAQACAERAVARLAVIRTLMHERERREQA